MGLLVEHNSIPLFIDFPLLCKYLIDYSIAKEVSWGSSETNFSLFWHIWLPERSIKGNYKIWLMHLHKWHGVLHLHQFSGRLNLAVASESKKGPKRGFFAGFWHFHPLIWVSKWFWISQPPSYMTTCLKHLYLKFGIAQTFES